MNPNRPLRFILNSILLLAVSVALFGGLALTASAQAQSGGTTTLAQAIPPDYGLTQTANAAGLPVGDVSPIEIAATVINVILGVLGVILVILVIYGGFIWMTAAGDEQKITKAKALLGNAVIGLAIVLAAYAITYFTVGTIAKSTGYPWQAGSSQSGPGDPPTCASQGGTCYANCPGNSHSIGQSTCSSGQLCCVPD